MNFRPARPLLAPRAAARRLLASRHGLARCGVRALTVTAVHRSDIVAVCEDRHHVQALLRPTNYVWNLSVILAIEMGARIGEIEANMCAPLQEVRQGPRRQAGTRAFRDGLTWVPDGRQAVRIAPWASALAAPPSNPEDMFKYFPTNYVWNLRRSAIEMSAGEKMCACAPRRPATCETWAERSAGA